MEILIFWYCLSRLYLFNLWAPLVNSVHTRCIVKTSGFTRGVCRNLDFIKFKGFLVEFQENSRSWENQKPQENCQKSGLFWASPFTMHLVWTQLIWVPLVILCLRPKRAGKNPAPIPGTHVSLLKVLPNMPIHTEGASNCLGGLSRLPHGPVSLYFENWNISPKRKFSRRIWVHHRRSDTAANANANSDTPWTFASRLSPPNLK